jgi:hypothetical protein
MACYGDNALFYYYFLRALDCYGYLDRCQEIYSDLSGRNMGGQDKIELWRQPHTEDTHRFTPDFGPTLLRNENNEK